MASAQAVANATFRDILKSVEDRNSILQSRNFGLYGHLEEEKKAHQATKNKLAAAQLALKRLKKKKCGIRSIKKNSEKALEKLDEITVTLEKIELKDQKNHEPEEQEKAKILELQTKLEEKNQEFFELELTVLEKDLTIKALTEKVETTDKKLKDYFKNFLQDIGVHEVPRVEVQRAKVENGTNWEGMYS